MRDDLATPERPPKPPAYASRFAEAQAQKAYGEQHESARLGVCDNTAILVVPPVFSPVISAEFTVAPEVVYSPIELPYATKTSEPSIAKPPGGAGSVINEAFTVAPETVYSLIALLK